MPAGSNNRMKLKAPLGGRESTEQWTWCSLFSEHQRCSLSGVLGRAQGVRNANNRFDLLCKQETTR
jgi:hypothetical protein